MNSTKSISSPELKPKQAHPSRTAIDCASYHPSPNRTEAAAAMMHLFSSSKKQKKAAQAAAAAQAAVGKANSSLPKLPKLPQRPNTSNVSKTTKLSTADDKKQGDNDSTKASNDDTSLTNAISVNARNLFDAEVEEDPEDSDMNTKAKAKAKSLKDKLQIVVKKEVLPTVDENEENLCDDSPKKQRLVLSSSPRQVDGAEWKELDEKVICAPFREYNRKEKSLGLLCENFLNQYRDDKFTEICLDRAAVELGVERRRIYDIVNILESIHLVSRKSKNLYNWHGLDALPRSTAAMKQRYEELQRAKGAGIPSCSYDYNLKDRRRGKSLSKLSQMFVQLFLAQDHCIIPLDEAAKQLIQMEEKQNEDDRLLKTKIRRLYDVANVLVSVGLIEKLQISNSRKPVFRWREQADVGLDSSASSTVTIAPTPRSSSLSLIVSPEIKSERRSPMKSSNCEAYDNSMMVDDFDSSKTSQSCDDEDSQENSCLCTELARPTGSNVSASSTTSTTSTTGKKRARQRQDKAQPEKRRRLDKQPLDAKVKGSAPAISASPISRSSCSTLPATTTAVSNDRGCKSSEEELSLLRFDDNRMPIHPRVILKEQQERMHHHMQRYIQQYLRYVLLHNVEISLPSANTNIHEGNDTDASQESTSASMENNNNNNNVAFGGSAMEYVGFDLEQETRIQLEEFIHRTPVNTSTTAASRVPPELMGSVQDALLGDGSTNTTSPQSVCDVFRAIGPSSTGTGSNTTATITTSTTKPVASGEDASERSPSPTTLSINHIKKTKTMELAPGETLIRQPQL